MRTEERLELLALTLAEGMAGSLKPLDAVYVLGIALSTVIGLIDVPETERDRLIEKARGCLDRAYDHQQAERAKHEGRLQ